MIYCFSPNVKSLYLSIFSMTSEDRAKILKEIYDLEAENKELSSKHTDLLNRKDELLKISNDLKQQIQARGEKEIKSIDNERNFISQKSAHDEEAMKESFQTKLDIVLKQKEEMQRKLEAESEYVSRILKERLAKIHQKTLNLRTEIADKSKKLFDSSQDFDQNAVDNKDKNHNENLVRQKIAEIKKYLDETQARIIESQKEIDILTAKGQRYTRILESLTNQINEKTAEKKKEAPRRKSFFTKRNKLLPEMS